MNDSRYVGGWESPGQRGGESPGENKIQTLKDQGTGWSSASLLKSPRICVARENVSQVPTSLEAEGEINIFRKEGRW